MKPSNRSSRLLAVRLRVSSGLTDLGASRPGGSRSGRPTLRVRDDTTTGPSKVTKRGRTVWRRPENQWLRLTSLWCGSTKAARPYATHWSTARLGGGRAGGAWVGGGEKPAPGVRGPSLRSERVTGRASRGGVSGARGATATREPRGAPPRIAPVRSRAEQSRCGLAGASPDRGGRAPQGPDTGDGPWSVTGGKSGGRPAKRDEIASLASLARNDGGFDELASSLRSLRMTTAGVSERRTFAGCCVRGGDQPAQLNEGSGWTGAERDGR